MHFSFSYSSLASLRYYTFFVNNGADKVNALIKALFIGVLLCLLYIYDIAVSDICIDITMTS